MRFILAFMLIFTAQASLAQQLVMVEQHGCHWCERWNTEIAPAWPNTAEGRFAPLQRVDIADAAAAVTLARRVVYTPTFLLVDDGAELARIEGYAGEDFFWPMVAAMLRNHSAFDGSS